MVRSGVDLCQHLGRAVVPGRNGKQTIYTCDAEVGVPDKQVVVGGIPRCIAVTPGEQVDCGGFVPVRDVRRRMQPGYKSPSREG